MSEPWEISSMELGRRLERCKLDAVLIANQWGPQEHEAFMRNAVERVEELQLWLDGWNRDKGDPAPGVFECEQCGAQLDISAESKAREWVCAACAGDDTPVAGSCDCEGGTCKHADKYAKAYAAKCAQRRAKRGNR